MTISIPCIHNNGTSKEMLLRDYEMAYDAVYDALKAIKKIEFNARDYYVINADAWPRAVAERDARMLKLTEVANEIEQIIIGIQAQKR